MVETNIFAIFALVNGIVSALFGVLVIFRNWRSQLNRVFFLMTISLAVWSFSYWQWQLALNYNTALLWVQILSAGSLFIPVLFYHWVLILINVRTIMHRFVLWGAYGVSILILPLINTHFFITGLTSKANFQFWPNPGIAYGVYIYIYIGIITYTLFLLMRAYLSTNDTENRGKILYVILGGILGFGGGLTNFPLWWDIPLLPFGNALVAAFPFLLGYSIIKYKLFNVKTIIAEMLVFTLMVFILTIVLLAPNIILRFVYSIFFALTGIVGIILVRNSYALEETNARQVTLIHFISHEVKGFLTKDVNTMSVLAEGDLGTLPNEADTFVKSALSQTRDAVRSVMSILQASNLKNGTVAYNMTQFDIVPVVKKSFAALQQVASEKGLTFTLSVDQRVGSYVITGDAGMLGEHVFHNLIENAIVYTPKGSVTVALGKNDVGEVIFAIKDTGVGISDEDKKRLFTEGGQGKDSHNINVHSTGYGLYIAKQIVEAHHGAVHVDSNGVGRGSTFVVELPG